MIVLAHCWGIFQLSEISAVRIAAFSETNLESFMFV